MPVFANFSGKFIVNFRIILMLVTLLNDFIQLVYSKFQKLANFYQILN